MRADRLLSILMLLQTRGRMTAHDLADKLEVSVRTIYRDLEALSIAGIPIYAERGPGGGCWLMDGYQTKLTGLTEAEVQALFLAAMAGPLTDLGLAKTLDAALLKVSAALPPTARDQAEQMRQRVHLDAAWWYHSDDLTPILQTIQQALWRDQKLYLVYLEDDGAWSEQLVEPYGLVAKAHVWYLVGCIYTIQRVFRVARIQAAELTAEPFVRPVDFDLAGYWAEYCAQSEASSALYAALLRLAPDEARMLPQMLLSQGYMLAEQSDVVEEDARVIPIRPRQQKKEATPAYFTRRSAHSLKEKKLFVLDNAGEWRALSHQREEKKRILKLKKENALQPSAKKTAIRLSPIKKRRLPSLAKKTYLNVSPTKKSHGRAPAVQKKQIFPSLFKKNLYASVSLCSLRLVA